MSKKTKTAEKLAPETTIPLIRRLLLENARSYLRQYAVAFVFMGAVAASTAASAWIMKDVINEVFINQDKGMIVAIALFVMAIFTVKGASTYGQQVVLSRVGNAIVADCQRRLFARLLEQDMAYYSRTPLGELTTRIQHNTSAARAVIDLVVVSLGRDVLTIIGLVAVMIAQDPLLSLFALVIMPPAVIGVSLLVRRVRKHAKSQFVSTTRILSVLQETALGIRIVKAFGVEDRLQAAMNAAVGDVERQANKIASLTARTSPLMETLGGFAVALVILYGGYSVVEMGQEPGAFFSFITSLLLAYDPAKRLARLQVNLTNSLVGVRLMYDLIDEEPELKDAADARPLGVTAGEVRFEDVSFSYGEGSALNGLTFVAEAGRTTALVGASGAGKSTVFALIERFYDPASGRIAIDGQALSGVSLASLRRSIAYVSQDTFLFDLSVRDNIRLGRPEASDEEVMQAARDANAHDFITAMPKGYDSSVGEGGDQLSGGQRQRIAIARAMLRNAPILLLDEATSALDAESEAKVQAALERLMQGRTTLVIAHRLSTVMHADKIVVMDRGRCVEEGTHVALNARDGIYRRLCDLQFRAGQREAAPAGADPVEPGQP
ncbi:ABC transporter ATP-binding protein [Roseibium aestuarii]|uniref:ABC transporter ATP-binding protein n=1 Tax=Roseibium aestuarii TaxID=2600299 RepID=A0ABW4JSG8_9HYPH|nr:ABC transporter ATP-binding protein [Roseibium aestuarii]